MSAAIIVFQLIIIASVLAARAISNTAVLGTCLAWSVFTILMVFTSPLLLLQLGVIWTTYALLLSQRNDVSKAPCETERSKRPSVRTPASHKDQASLFPLQIGDDRPEGSGRKGDDAETSLNLLHSYDPRPYVRKYVEAKGVPFLVHFTDVVNLQSIVRHGILSVSELEQRTIPFARNDSDRLDGHACAISLSIAHPNDRLFLRWRRENKQRRWVVLLIDPSVLWENQVKFCSWNAADHRERDVGRWSHQGFASLKLMFAPQNGLPSRAEQNLHPYDPTNVQAEALVFDPVPPEKIVGAVFNDHESMAMIPGELRGRRIDLVDDRMGLFGMRSSARTLVR